VKDLRINSVKNLIIQLNRPDRFFGYRLRMTLRHSLIGEREGGGDLELEELKLIWDVKFEGTGLFVSALLSYES